MLVRQQAQATVDARKLVVTGAVGIAVDAIESRALPLRADAKHN
jgi:hypothetical protein